MQITALAHHLFLPPSTATGIPVMMSRAPRTPYAGSMTMVKGIQSSPSFHSIVPFAVVPFADVPLLDKVELTVAVVFPGEFWRVELSVSVRTIAVGDGDAVPCVTSEVMVVVMTVTFACEVPFVGTAETEDALRDVADVADDES